MTGECGACGAGGLRAFHAQTGIPVNSCLLLDDAEAALTFPTGDLELAFCEACGFIENRRFEPEAVTYSELYEESQGFSAHFRRFMDELIEDQDRKYGLGNRTVLEIGCGKGDFLLRLVETTGARGIGFDPAFRPDRASLPAGSDLAFRRERYGPGHAGLAVDYVCCRHTLEHIPDVSDFVGMIRANLGERADVPVFFEVPDTRRVLQELAFWDVYYEHCSYFTAGSLGRLFERAGFAVSDVRRAYGDQYLLLEAMPGRPGDAPSPVPDDIGATAALVERFAGEVPALLRRLRAELEAWRSAGRTVALWGAGSKAVAYLTTLGLKEEIAAVVDVNPHKAGKYLAGTGHRIDLPRSLVRVRPDVVVVMNAVYREEIRAELESLGLAPEIRALD